MEYEVFEPDSGDDYDDLVTAAWIFMFSEGWEFDSTLPPEGVI